MHKKGNFYDENQRYICGCERYLFPPCKTCAGMHARDTLYIADLPVTNLSGVR